MANNWPQTEHPVVIHLDRPVMVNMARVFPGLGSARRQDELPLWVRAFGLRLDPWMPARQTAWVRRSDGGWLALAQCTAASTNGHTELTMSLWLEPDALTTDLTAGR
ncbi:MAG: hypothetical protein CK429_32485 [Mycobacterium sp.]|nr:MAG: hypothetical protein CK429_32485 [Mycobacterium sp.]